MKKKEMIRLLRSRRKLYVYVRFNDDEGGYIRADKSDMMVTIKNHIDDDFEFNAYATDISIFIG